MSFTQTHKKQPQKNKESIFNLKAQYLEQYTSTTAGIQGLASSEQAGRGSDGRRERRWKMVELKDRQQ